jgi:hypothetical protein
VNGGPAWDLVYFSIFQYAQLTPEFIDEIYEKWPRLALHISYGFMSMNRNLSLNDLEKIDKKHKRSSTHWNSLWRLEFIASRGDIMPQDIITSHLFAEQSLHQIYYWLSSNPNITEEFILNNVEHMSFPCLSRNKFLWDDDAYKISLMRDIKARQVLTCGDLGDIGRVVCKYIDYI